jgi:hypothetical protein
MEVSGMQKNNSRKTNEPVRNSYILKDKNKKIKKNNSIKKNILVVGDLFIDENWLMARAENYHSTNVGNFHYASKLDGPDSLILSLCGIANVLKIMSGSYKESKSSESLLHKYNLIGAGAWNPDDHDTLQCIICDRGRGKMNMTPYTLKGIKVAYPGTKGERICPYDKKLCEPLLKMINLIPNKNNLNSSTNRIFRIYEGFGGDQPRLRYRFDWKLEVDEELLKINQLKKIKNVAAVIIVDHGKGVVGPKVIKKLCELYKEADWYIRMKLASTSWLSVIKESKPNVRLIVIDEQLIKYLHGIRTWHHGSTLGRGSLEIMGNLLGLGIYQHGNQMRPESPVADNAAVLFEDDSAIAGTRLNKQSSLGNNDAALVYVPPPRGKKMPIQVGRTSVFFNVFTYFDLMKEYRLNVETLYGICERALATTYRWTEKCTEAWIAEKPSELSGPFQDVITWINEEKKLADNPEQDKTYNTCWNDWNASSTDLGIIDVKINDQEAESQLQLWRAYGILPQYICPGGIKRSNINRLVSALVQYMYKGNPNFPFNCLFLAEPGWGKSYLAKCLANYFKFEYLEYSMAQMSSTRDLIDAFKVIVSTQKRSDKKVLVFMDEIDAAIEGHTALGLLLGPMWDGIFKIDGNTNKIDPCVWVFASTKPLSKLRGMDKGPDFLSRINGPTINLDYLDEIMRSDLEKSPDEKTRKKHMANHVKANQALRTELVYQGVNILNRLFGPITHVDKGVLDLFNNMLPLNGIRSLTILVSRFQGITKGKVTKSNVPKLYESDAWKEEIDSSEPLSSAGLKRHIYLLDIDQYNIDYEDNIEKQKLIRIRFNP